MHKKEMARTIQVKLKTPNPKSFWSTINNLLGKRTFSNSLELCGPNGDTISDPEMLTEMFFNFVKDKVINLAHSIPEDPERPLTSNNHLVFSLEELQEALKNIKSKHCYGFNGIPLRIAKDLSTSLPQRTLEYFNSIAKCGLSDDQRIARIIPLHKKGSESEISNY
jgi:hypothetical protein